MQGLPLGQFFYIVFQLRTCLSPFKVTLIINRYKIIEE